MMDEQSKGGADWLQLIRDASARISLATSELVQATPAAMEQAEIELRAAVGILAGAVRTKPDSVENLALTDLRTQIAVTSRLLHQAASVRFSLAAQLYGAAESYTALGRTTLTIQPEAATMVARG